MNEKLRVFVTLGVLVFLIVGFYLTSKTITDVTGRSIAGWIIKGLDDQDSCLEETDITLYVRQGCGYCVKQKDTLGDDINLFNVVECSETPEICSEAGIRGVPTWKINGQEYLGVKTLDQVKEIVGCEQ